MVQQKVRDILKEVISQINNTLDARVSSVTKESFLEIIEMFDEDHRMSFVLSVLKMPTHETLTSTVKL